MLVLSRREGETIVVGGDIRVTVCRITEGKVKLGIDAPQGTRVDREEVDIARSREAAGTWVEREE